MKHKKHGKENLIGKIIYGFLLFMPLLAIFATCAYAIFNKNAYQSYYGENINETQYISTNQLKSNKNYKYSYTSYGQITAVNQRFGVSNFEFISASNSGVTSTISALSNVYELRYWINTGANDQQNLQIFYLDNNNTSQSVTISLFNNSTGYTTLNYTFTAVSNITLESTFNNVLTEIVFINESYISEVFYYSIDKVEQSPLFNWANETATYNVLETTCETLGITTTFIPMLLSYWLMTSLMYLLYDIALLVVHMAHNRIHDIESSI